MIGGFLNRLDELAHHMGRARLIGIAHTEVDDVLTPTPCLLFQDIGDIEYIGGKPLDTIEFHSCSSRPGSRARLAPVPHYFISHLAGRRKLSAKMTVQPMAAS